MIRQRFIGDGCPLVESFVGSRVVVGPHGPGLDHIGLQIDVIVSRVLGPVEGPVPLDAQHDVRVRVRGAQGMENGGAVGGGEFVLVDAEAP